MSTTFVENQALSTVTCYKCAMLFAIPDMLMTELRRSHDAFFCPNGHSQAYLSKSKEEKLVDQVAQLQTEIEHKDAYATRLHDSLQSSRRSCSAVKGVVTRIKNRVGAGVCPCCNRTFQCLARHMDSKHPEFRQPPT